MFNCVLNTSLEAYSEGKYLLKVNSMKVESYSFIIDVTSLLLNLRRIRPTKLMTLSMTLSRILAVAYFTGANLVRREVSVRC